MKGGEKPHLTNDTTIKNILTHASVFSGIGGAELAASWMGWKNLFHCEIQQFPRQVLDYWFPNSESYEDITKTTFTKWKGKVDVLTGGFPCQPFSYAGSRKGAEDDRYLWPEMLRAVREIQPTWVVAENAVGITTMVQPSSVTEMGRSDFLFEESVVCREEYRYILDAICEDIEREGYEVQPLVIPACATGAPHRRNRIWIVAHRTDTGLETLQQEGQDGVSAPAPPPYAYSCGGDQVHHQAQFQEPDGNGTDSPCHERQAAITEESSRGNRGFTGFPSVQPTICRGDDGLPFDVDDLAISEGKWRKESIKAYGNAWVPQVALEIFKAIEEYNNN